MYRQLLRAARNINKLQRVCVTQDAKLFSSASRIIAASSPWERSRRGRYLQFSPSGLRNTRTFAEKAPALGSAKRLPEFSLADKVILVSGAARGLGLTQAEALLEAGATGEVSPPSSRAIYAKSYQH